MPNGTNPKSRVTINVISFSGEIVSTVNCTKNTSIEEVKKQVGEDLRRPWRAFDLVAGTQPLQNTQTLKDSHIRGTVSLSLVKKVKKENESDSDEPPGLVDLSD